MNPVNPLRFLSFFSFAISKLILNQWALNQRPYHRSLSRINVQYNHLIINYNFHIAMTAISKWETKVEKQNPQMSSDSLSKAR